MKISLVVLFLFFGISSFMIKYTDARNLNASNHQPKKSQENQSPFNSKPADPPKKANPKIFNEQKVYISIIDTEYGPSEHQCNLKNSWFDDVYKLDFIDGIEIYSNVSFHNSQCSITSVSFPPPPPKFNLNINPSCIISNNLLHLFLERTEAGWLLILTDSSYVNSKNLKNLIDSLNCPDPMKTPQAGGLCTEIRDYFQVFNKNSGMILSRKTVEMIVSEKTARTWNVSCEIEIDSSEALAHALDINWIYAIHNDRQEFLGNPFSEMSDYKSLLSGRFSNIPKCPVKYSSPRVCHHTVQSFKNLAVWSAVGKHMNKYDFIKNAKQMIENAPDSLMFKYNSYESELCFY